ncbi:metal-dependent hydrolase [Paenibacillus sediminis]|uniref:UPF0173 metal-dependent hydrolase J2Z20_002257 n=1 Tax=Paenibacillus sediminis TaxID=664909 RepID=A0ABS4H4R2_9BACL|nr:metal-dependent hydrolase [Paenibacillus sediminis]MBP1937362.1 L-ascorbate metabolism protein UlaG (beta-lactamase superfamily) [Paenibacillus sediminis]
MKITYYGHSTILVEGGNKRVIIDPFLSGNPHAVIKSGDVKVDAILLTHGHNDHFGDSIEIARNNNCPIIAIVELADYWESKGVKTIGMNIGGKYKLEGVTVKFTLAFHSSSVETENGPIYAGEPAGILLTMEGKTFYHAGDTGLFGDMRLIGELNQIDAAALPIGDFFTMGPEDALIAAEWIRAKRVIPIHYNTFPIIEQNGTAFCNALQEKGIQGIALQIGESIEI